MREYENGSQDLAVSVLPQTIVSRPYIFPQNKHGYQNKHHSLLFKVNKNKDEGKDNK